MTYAFRVNLPLFSLPWQKDAVGPINQEDILI